ncbi:hypothetical protein WN943_025400 [Citrus x changshan-huyou]
MKLASFISPKDLYVKCFDHRKPWDLLRPEILLGKQCPNLVLGPKLKLQRFCGSFMVLGHVVTKKELP